MDRGAKCLADITCILCIAVAGSLAIGKIAECGTAAFEAEALVAPANLPLAIGAVLTTFVGCSTGPVAAFLSATVLCIEGATRIGDLG